MNNKSRSDSDQYIDRILEDYAKIHGTNMDDAKREIVLGVRRDQQAQLLPPNVKVPSRRKVLSYLRTMYNHSGSFSLTIKSLMKPGSWTSSGGSFRLASENGIDFEHLLTSVCTELGAARFLEIGAAYGGFERSNGNGHNSIKSLHDKLRKHSRLNVSLHFTNLTQWHSDLPEGVYEHPGIAASTISRIAGICDKFDVVYSQCAAYFDVNVTSFTRQIASLVRPSTHGGLLIFNAKPEDVSRICDTAKEVMLNLEHHKEIGGMNGDFLVFKKTCGSTIDSDSGKCITTKSA